VDSATNTFVLRTPVPSDHVAFATAWYNRIADDSYTLTVIAPGPSGVGTFGITSQLTGNAPLFSVKFGSKSARNACHRVCDFRIANVKQSGVNTNTLVIWIGGKAKTQARPDTRARVSELTQIFFHTFCVPIEEFG
jgi:hypothetical protein